MEELGSIIEFSVDIGKAEAPEPLPAGTYIGTIREAVQKISQRDTRYVAVAFFISPDQYPPDYTDGNPDGTTLTYRRVSVEDNPQAHYRTRKFCEAIGATASKKLDLTEWVGLEGALEVVHEKYEGEDRANINRVNAV